MMNLSSASTNSTPVDSDNEAGIHSATLEKRPADLSILRARGRLPSEQDVSQFQQALTQSQRDSEDQLSDTGTNNVPVGPTVAELSSASSIPLTHSENTHQEVTNKENSNGKPEAVNSPLSARMRWIERRKFWESETDQVDVKPSSDGTVPIVQPSDNKGPQPLTEVLAKNTSEVNTGVMRGGQAPEESVAQPSAEVLVSKPESTTVESLNSTDSLVNKVRARVPLSDSADQMVEGRHLDTSPSPISSALPATKSELNFNPKIEATASTLDTAWASRTVQDTVRTTLRTLALRDLESLDAGRPVQITLDQGQLRGAQLTLQAQNGLLEVSVSTPVAQLRATLDAAQDALAQGLLRDVGAVRWIGLQDALPMVSTNGDASFSSATSQQNSQGNGSERQNQGQRPASEPDEMVLTENKTDKHQVVADAKSLRAFLGL